MKTFELTLCSYCNASILVQEAIDVNDGIDYYPEKKPIYLCKDCHDQLRTDYGEEKEVVEY
jgi:uncharacterized protein with PIN domain